MPVVPLCFSHGGLVVYVPSHSIDNFWADYNCVSVAYKHFFFLQFVTPLTLLRFWGKPLLKGQIGSFCKNGPYVSLVIAPVA